MTAIEWRASVERWPIEGAFRTAKVTRHETAVVVVEARADGFFGRGECVPYDGYGETVESVLEQLERAEMPEELPLGAARNGMELAAIDLECKRLGVRVHELLDCAPFEGCRTAYTIGIDSPEAMEASAARRREFATLKIKAGPDDALLLAEAVHRGAPDARLVVDGNESWTMATLTETAEALAGVGVVAIEQPLPRDADEALRRGSLPVAVLADESCHSTADVHRLAERYDGVNLKLGKTGGLREALAAHSVAKEEGLLLMVGCAVSTSLAIAPALLLASDAFVVDLDGPLLLARDREPGLSYEGDAIAPFGPDLWG